MRLVFIFSLLFLMTILSVTLFTQEKKEKQQITPKPLKEKFTFDKDFILTPKKKEALPRVKILEIGSKNLNTIYDLTKDGAKKDIEVVILNASFSNLNSDHNKIIKKFISNGGNLWSDYDCAKIFLPNLTSERGVDYDYVHNVIENSSPIVSGVKKIRLDYARWAKYNKKLPATEICRDSKGNVKLFAFTYGKGKVFVSPSANRGFDKSRYDTSRFYTNTLLWLSGREVPGVKYKNLPKKCSKCNREYKKYEWKYCPYDGTYLEGEKKKK